MQAGFENRPSWYGVTDSDEAAKPGRRSSSPATTSARLGYGLQWDACLQDTTMFPVHQWWR